MIDENKYKDGTDTNKFIHLEEISDYCHNYYKGYDKDLLFAESDDDNTTEWWLIKGNISYYLGESYTSDGEKLIRYSSQRG